MVDETRKNTKNKLKQVKHRSLVITTQSSKQFRCPRLQQLDKNPLARVRSCGENDLIVLKNGSCSTVVQER